MNRNQVKWMLVALASLLCFAFLIPIVWFFDYPIVVSMLGGLVTAFFIALTLLDIKSMYELFAIDEKQESKGFYSVLLPFVAFAAFGVLIYMVNNNRINTKLETEGIITKAIIENGSETVTESLRRGKSSSYQLYYSYTDTITKKQFKKSTEVSSSIFRGMHKGKAVELIYLPSNPAVVHLLLDTRYVNRFKHISNRNLALSDLEALLDLPTHAQKMKYLNDISVDWELSEDEYGVNLFNDVKQEWIGVPDSEKLFFKGPSMLQFIPNNSIVKDEKVAFGSDKEMQRRIETKTLRIYEIHKLIKEENNFPSVEFLLIVEKL